MKAKHRSLAEMEVLWEVTGGFLWEAQSGRFICRESLPTSTKPKRIFYSQNWGLAELTRSLAANGKLDWVDLARSVEQAVLEESAGKQPA